MTNQHRATDEQWASLRETSAASLSSCLLELRDRIQQLEAVQHAHILQGHCNNGTAGSGPSTRLHSYKIENSAVLIKNWGKNHTLATAPSSLPPTLVERVKHQLIKGLGGTWEKTSCAVICEVARWLDERDIETQNDPDCLEAPTADDAVRWLRGESNQ